MRKLKTDELNRVSVEEFKTQKKRPIIVALDSIRSMNNVGSVFRTCDAFAIQKLILGGITAQPPHRDIHKTAIGAEDAVNWEHTADLTTSLKELKREGYTIYGIEQTDKSTFLNDFNYQSNDKIVLVFGNEVFGVSDEVLEVCDGVLEIPQFGTKHSLNISVSVGVVLWELVR